MSGENITLGMQFKVDGKDGINAIKVSREELKGLREEQAKTADQQKQAAREVENLKKKTEEYVQALVKKVSTLGMGRNELLRYEAAQLQLTEAEQRAVVSMQQSVDAYEKREAAVQSFIGAAGRATTAALAAGVAIAAMIKKESIDQAVEAAQANVRLETTLKATNYAAGLTSKQLNELGEELSRAFQFKDDEIKNGIATMLKFKNVQSEMFETAIRDAADYAVAMNTDFRSAAEIIGRAYQDVDHAQRAVIATGGRYEDSQKAQIAAMMEAGKVVEAQEILHRKFAGTIGGTAAAMNTGLMKAQSDSKKAWDQLMQSIGETDQVGGRFQRTAESMTTFVQGINGAVNGTDSTMLRWFADISAATPGLMSFNALLREQADAMDRRKSSRGPTFGELMAEDQKREDAIKGKEAQDEVRRTEAKARADALAKAAAAERAKAYATVKQAADDYLDSLADEIQLEDRSTAFKIAFVAQKRAAKLATEEERDAYMGYATTLGEAKQQQEEYLNQKKATEAAAKRMVEAQAKELDAIDKEISKQKEHNYELINGKGSYQDYTAAMLDNTLMEQEAAGATEEDTAALRAKIKALRELASLKATGEAIEDAQRAEQEFFRKMTRDAQQWGNILEDIVEQALSGGGVKGSDIIKRLFSQMVLRPGIQGLTGGDGGIGGISGMINGISGASSIGNFLMGGGFAGSSLLNGGATLASNLGMTSISNFLGGMTGAVAGPTATGAAAGGGAAAFGAEFAAFASNPVTLAVAAAIAIWKSGIFDDGPENPKFRWQFSQGGQKTAFGNIGITGDYQSAAGTQLLEAIGNIDKVIADNLSPAAIAAAQARLAAYDATGRRASGDPAEMAFPAGDPSAEKQVIEELFRGRYATIVDVMGEEIFGSLSSHLGDLLRNASGTADEFGALLTSIVNLTTAGKQIDDVIAGLGTEAIPNLKGQLDAFDAQVAEAQKALDAAIASRDPNAVMAAEQNLQQMIVARYQTERGWIQQLASGLDQLKQQAYDFQLSIGQRMNSAGGKFDIAGLAAGRGSDVRSSLASITDPAKRVSAIQNYLSAIDTEYAARKDAILNEANSLQQQQQAAAAMQSAIAQARIAALQDELQLAGQWNGVLSQTRQMIDSLRYSAASPLSAQGRYGLATGDSNALFAQFQSATGADKIALANRLLPTLQQRSQLLGQTEQRPSDGYLAGYNQLQAMLAEVEQYSQSQADRAEQLQIQMVALQGESNSIATTAAVDTTSLLDELNAQYRDQLQFAYDEGTATYTQQEQQHQELLNQITGGQEVDLFSAQMLSDTRGELRDIKDILRAFLEAVAGGAGADTSGATTSTTGAGGNTGGSAGAGGSVVIQQPINLQLDGKTLASFTIDTVRANASTLARDAAFNS